jgi:hypothetical protein
MNKLGLIAALVLVKSCHFGQLYQQLGIADFWQITAILVDCSASYANPAAIRAASRPA